MMANHSNSGLDSRRAWIVVFAAFLGSFVSFGIAYTFGVFLKPMELEFHTGHAVISSVFSTAMVLSFFLSPLTGNLADRYGPRPIVAAGAVFMCAGLVITGRNHSLPLLFVTYGIGVGCGISCVYVPSVAAVGEWFKVHRVVALGTAISGIGCGTLVAAPLSAILIERYGWSRAFEIFGWSGGALLLLSAALFYRPPVAGGKATGSVGLKVRTRAFALLYGSLLLSGIATYISIVFLPAYSMDLGATRVAGATLVGYIGASSVVGRLGLNALTSRFGLLRVYQLSNLILLLSFAFWLAGHSYPQLVAFSWVMGLGYGGIAAMLPAVAASIFGVEGLGALLGILSTALGVGCLVGPPSAGAIADHFHDYKGPVFLAAITAALALAVILLLRQHEANPSEAIKTLAEESN